MGDSLRLLRDFFWDFQRPFGWISSNNPPVFKIFSDFCGILEAFFRILGGLLRFKKKKKKFLLFFGIFVGILKNFLGISMVVKKTLGFSSDPWAIPEGWLKVTGDLIAVIIGQ